MDVVLVVLFLKCSHTFEHLILNSDKINTELSEEIKKNGKKYASILESLTDVLQVVSSVKFTFIGLKLPKEQLWQWKEPTATAPSALTRELCRAPPQQIMFLCLKGFPGSCKGPCSF